MSGIVLLADFSFFFLLFSIAHHLQADFSLLVYFLAMRYVDWRFLRQLDRRYSKWTQRPTYAGPPFSYLTFIYRVWL